jgi:hypothetical protein
MLNEAPISPVEAELELPFLDPAEELDKTVNFTSKEDERADDASDTSLVAGTADDKEENRYSAKEKNQQPANLRMSVASNEDGEVVEKPTEKQQEALAAKQSEEDESADEADRQPPKDIADDLVNDTNKDVPDQDALPESATEKVVPEKRKGSTKVEINFMCPWKVVCNGAQPKTVDKLQEHLCLRHNLKKGSIGWPTVEGVRDGTYQKFLEAHELFFEREDKKTEPEHSSKSAPYIRKRGGILDADSDGSVYKPNSDSERESDGSPCEGLKEIGYTKPMYKMRFSRQDDEEDTRKTRRGIEMPKFPHRAPKGSKTQAASFISEDDDTSAISGTTDDEENLRSTKQTKKQHPATLRKASEDASNPAWSDDEDKEPKKASKKLATVRKGIPDSNQPSQKTSKKKQSCKRQRQADLSSGEEDEGLASKVPTCPKCQKSFENKNNVRRHLINVHGFNRKSEELS